jgi:dihydrofolate reductase
MRFDIIVAVDSEFGIAKNGDLPWKDTPAGREDMNWFKERTSEPGTAVIMGRKTWESIPEKFRPLKGRINVVVSSQYPDTTIRTEDDEIVVRTGSFERALNWCENAKDACDIKKCMVIGGKSIYE